MWNKPDRRALSNLPDLYSTEGTPLMEKFIFTHFFLGECDWYVAEYDGNDLFFGFAILNGDTQNAEWGYFSLSELDSLSISGIEVDRDLYWKIRKACEVDTISKCQREVVHD